MCPLFGSLQNEAHCHVLLQVWRKLSLLKNASQLSTIEQVQQHWRLLCEKKPKGFDKFFKRGQKAKETEAPAKEAKSAKSEEPSTQRTSYSSSNPKKEPFNQSWHWKRMGSAGDGPFKGNDKWFTLGVLGCLGLIGALTYMEREKEITWREFVYR